MSLIKTELVEKFDATQIRPGDLVYVKYHAWEEGVTGLVGEVKEDKITIFYLKGSKSASNYFVILVSEVAAGSWLIRWSSDLVTIQDGGDGP